MRGRWLARAVGALLLVGCAAPFWAGRFLPFLDLPQHLGLATVLARHGDPSTAFARYYELDARLTPYWGYYGAMWLLARALPIELANRLVFTAYALATPLAAAYLLASFGRDRRWAVFTVPLVFGTNLFFGFATFLLSIPLFLLALGLTERHLAGDRVRARHAVPLAISAAAVELCHAQTYALLGVCVAILLAVHARGARWIAARAAPYLLSLALFAPWFWRSFVAPERAAVEEHTARHRTYGALGGLQARWEPLPASLRAVPERIAGAFADRSDLRLAAAAAILLALALATSYGPAPAGGASGARGWLLRRRCDLVLAALAASYLASPIEMAGQWYISPRHLLFAALALPLLLARPATGWRAALAGAAAMAAVATCANAAAKVRAFQRQVGDFAPIAAALPPGGRVLGLPFDYGSGGPVRLWPLLHFACFEQVLAGGDVGFSFAGLPSIPVRYRPGLQAPHPYEWRPEEFDWAAMGPFYDAYLTSGVPRGRGGADLLRHAVPAVRSGAFTLWKPRSPRLTPAEPSSTYRPP